MAMFAGATVNTCKTVSLTAVGSPLKAALRGPGSDIIKADQLVVLDASASGDPDDPNGNKPLTFTWDCTREDFPAPCFATTDRGSQKGSTWALNATLLTPDVEHTFTVTVNKGSRSAVAPPVKFTTRAAKIPLARIVRQCGGAGEQSCPGMHNVDKPLGLLLRLDPSSTGATWAWSSDQMPSISSIITAELNVAPSNLTATGMLVVCAVLQLEGVEGRASIQVPLNGRPTCVPPAGESSCLRVVAHSAEFSDNTFELVAAGWVDDNGTL